MAVHWMSKSARLRRIYRSHDKLGSERVITVLDRGSTGLDRPLRTKVFIHVSFALVRHIVGIVKIRDGHEHETEFCCGARNPIRTIKVEFLAASLQSAFSG